MVNRFMTCTVNGCELETYIRRLLEGRPVLRRTELDAKVVQRRAAHDDESGLHLGVSHGFRGSLGAWHRVSRFRRDFLGYIYIYHVVGSIVERILLSELRELSLQSSGLLLSNALALAGDY